MKFALYETGGRSGLAVPDGTGWRGRAGVPAFADLLRADAEALATLHRDLAVAPELDPVTLRHLPPVVPGAKIVCVGLNYVPHVEENNRELPTDPAIFLRLHSSLIGDGAAMLIPGCSTKLDFEGELVAVIGRGGRNIPREAALQAVAGYTIFNDGSVRDFQRKGGQWTLGKNFDGTGACGPAFVPAAVVPHLPGNAMLETRVNGAVMQRATTGDMIFDLPRLIEILSEVMTLATGDLIVTGTPGGVGFARKPPIYLKAGDVCEVEIEGIGILRNPVAQAQDVV